MQRGCYRRGISRRGGGDDGSGGDGDGGPAYRPPKNTSRALRRALWAPLGPRHARACVRPRAKCSALIFAFASGSEQHARYAK